MLRHPASTGRVSRGAAAVKAFGTELAKLKVDLDSFFKQGKGEMGSAEGVKKPEAMSRLVFLGRNLRRFASRLAILMRRPTEGVKLSQQRELAQLDTLLQKEVGHLYQLQLAYAQSLFPMAWWAECFSACDKKPSGSGEAQAALQCCSLQHSLTSPKDLGLSAPDPEALRCQAARLRALQSVCDTWLAWLENWQPADPLALLQDSRFPIFRAVLEKASQKSLLEDGCKAPLLFSKPFFLCHRCGMPRHVLLPPCVAGGHSHCAACSALGRAVCLEREEAPVQGCRRLQAGLAWHAGGRGHG